MRTSCHQQIAETSEKPSLQYYLPDDGTCLNNFVMQIYFSSYICLQSNLDIYEHKLSSVPVDVKKYWEQEARKRTYKEDGTCPPTVTILYCSFQGHTCFVKILRAARRKITDHKR